MKKRFEVFLKFLKIYPLSHALPRGLESLLFREFELKPPILDIGCGDGDFTLLTFGKGKIDVGLDRDKEKIKQARKKGVYQKAVIADAQKLPFADNEFKIIIANSVLEHVENSDRALVECFRVLKPGGKFIFTVPGKKDLKYWFWSKIFNGLYTRIKNRLMGHSELYDKDVWIKKLKKAGFPDVEVFTYVPKKTVFLLDLFVPFGLFYYLTERVFGPRKLLARIFLPFFYVDEKDGLGYCFVAKKI